MPLCEKHGIESKYKCVKCTVEKRQATMTLRYGVKNALHSKEIKEKKDKTCLEKYGHVVVSKTNMIKEITKQRNLAQYGVEHVLQIKEIRDKGKETMMTLYGVENAIQNTNIKQKRVETNIERFGFENALQNPDILAKRRGTNMERYGIEEVLSVPDIKERIKQTMIDTYGAWNPLQCPEIMARKDQTCEERYGDKDIMHNATIFEKVVKNSFKKKDYILPSGKIIVYQGYENVAFDDLLKIMMEDDFTNDVKQMPRINYMYEGKMHRYYSDIYIPSQKKFIEVKSPYTYNKQLLQNNAKRDQVILDGYAFEFWICDKKSIIEIK